MLKNIFSNGIKCISSQLLAANSIVSQQVRVSIENCVQNIPSFHFNDQFCSQTTFVLKRLYPVELHRKNQKPRKLRGRHHVYEMIEDKNVKRKPDMEVVLKQFVQGIGKKGEVVSVRPNFAYQNLLLPGLADYVTPENVEKYKPKAGESNTDEEHSSPFAQRVMMFIKKIIFLFGFFIYFFCSLHNFRQLTCFKIGYLQL
jgi:hypothetical protein